MKSGETYLETVFSVMKCKNLLYYAAPTLTLMVGIYNFQHNSRILFSSNQELKQFVKMTNENIFKRLLGCHKTKNLKIVN